MLIRSIVVVLLLGTAGCATTNDVLGNEVDEVFHSAHPPALVAACFMHLNNLRVIERPDGTRVAAFRNGYGGVVKAFSIKPEGTGSLIESRHSDIGVPGIKWKRCVGLKPMPAGVVAPAEPQQ